MVARALVMTASIHEAEQAYFQFHLAESRALFTAFLTDEKYPLEDRGEGAHKLASLPWPVDADLREARRLLILADFRGENV